MYQRKRCAVKTFHLRQKKLRVRGNVVVMLANIVYRLYFIRGKTLNLDVFHVTLKQKLIHLKNIYNTAVGSFNKYHNYIQTVHKQDNN